MIWLKRLLIALVVLIAAFVLIGFLLPSRYQVERSVVIQAPPEAVHAYVGDLSRWEAWSPWIEVDPSIRVSLGDATTGVGGSQSWTGESGSGQLTFTSWDPARGVEYEMSFDEGAYAAKGAIRYAPTDGQTRVTWIMQGDMGRNIVGRYLGLLMDTMVGKNFERGLEKLKEAVEGGSAVPGEGELDLAPVVEPEDLEVEPPPAE